MSTIKKKKITDLPKVSTLYGFVTLGVDQAGNSVQVDIEQLKGNKGDKGDAGEVSLEQLEAYAKNKNQTEDSVVYAKDGIISVPKTLVSSEIAYSTSVGKYIHPKTGQAMDGSDYEYTGDPIDVTLLKGQYILVTACFATNPTQTSFQAGIAGYSTTDINSFVETVFELPMIGITTQGRHKVENQLVLIPNTVNFIRGCSAIANANRNETPLVIKTADEEIIQNIPIVDFAQDLDTRLEAVEDATIITEDLDATKVESGSVDVNGNLVVESTRLRTAKNYTGDYLHVTKINTGFEYRVIGYNKGQFVEMPAWTSTLKTWDFQKLGFTEAKLIFRRTNNGAITVADFTNVGFEAHTTTSLASLVLNGGAGSGGTASNVIARNRETEKSVIAVRKQFDTQNTTNDTAIFFMGHISDLHSDSVRLNNCIEYCKYLGVDSLAVTGDIVLQFYDQDFSFYKTATLNSDLVMLHVLGNHESEKGTNETDTLQHVRFFADLDTKMGMIHESKAYYYRDFADKKTRVIGLNQFQYGGSVRENRYLKDDQITWFINTLKSTPANYAVVILTHIPEREWSTDANYIKFWQEKLFFNDLMTNTQGSPIADIVDAFIGRTSISKTYTQTGMQTSLSVNANFSTGVNAGVEFIAYLNGHLHADRIGYLNDTTHKQLVLNIICGNAFVGAWRDGLGDLPRVAGTVAEDAFNIYGIDRTLKMVKIVRIGSNMNNKMEKRDFMAIPYK